VRRGVARAALCASVLSAAPSLLAAQVCDGYRINSIRIRNAGLFDGDNRVPRWVESLAGALSWRTRASVVANDLRFSEGDECDPLYLAETERLLRLRPYLRSAAIRTTPAPGGQVDVEVDTRDDWSLGGDLSIAFHDRVEFRSLRLTETNLMGQGILGRLRVDRRGREPGVVFDGLHPHLMRINYLQVQGGQTSVGPVAAVNVYRPFETELDRFGWFVGASRLEEPFGLHTDSIGPVTVPRLRQTFGINAQRRIGPEGLQVMGGVSVLYHRITQSGPALASDPANDSAAQAGLAGAYSDVRRFSVAVSAGARAIRRVAHSRLDAVHAIEDVSEGLEVRVSLGRALAISDLQPDWFAMAEGYLGAHVAGRTLLFVRTRTEGLRRPGATRWHDLIASGDVLTYTPSGRRGVIALAVRAAGGWRMRQPFQLSLGEGEGMRGYGRGHAVGRRVVAHGEYRHYAGTLRGIGDVGWAAFVDVGRGWAGGIPFAADHPWQAAAGGGLRFSLPPGSKYVARMDLAVPLRGGPVELRFSTRQHFTILRQEAADVARSRQPMSTQPPFNSFPY